jgi:hypothetical protein
LHSCLVIIKIRLTNRNVDVAQKVKITLSALHKTVRKILDLTCHIKGLHTCQQPALMINVLLLAIHLTVVVLQN